MYRAPDGKTFSSYTSFCDYMSMLASMHGDKGTAEYYKRERQKMIEKQEKSLPWFIAFIILGIIGSIVSAIVQ